MHLNHTMNVIIEAEPYLSQACKFREIHQRAQDKWQEFQDKYGAYAIAPNGAGLFFSEKSPEGWTKLEGRHGFSRPRSGTDADVEISELPRFPKAWDVFGDSLLFDLEFELNGKRNSVAISELWDGPEIGWNNKNVFCALIPNPIDAILEIKSKHPDALIMGGAEEWQLPGGLRRI